MVLVGFLQLNISILDKLGQPVTEESLFWLSMTYLQETPLGEGQSNSVEELVKKDRAVYRLQTIVGSAAFPCFISASQEVMR